MSTDAKELIKGLSSKEIEEIIRTKKQSEGIDPDLLELFEVNPAEYSLQELQKITLACKQAVADGRTTLKVQTFLRMPPKYKSFMTNTRSVTGANFTQAIIAFIEALMTGDLRIERRKTNRNEEKEWGQKYRVIIMDKHGIILNNTNLADRPDGLKL